jgi:hypothetical protein
MEVDMRTLRLHFSVPLVALAVLAAAPHLTANSVMQMNLEEMCVRAHAIFRGHVLSSSAGRVAVGGGDLAVVKYRLEVEESFRGEFETIKGVRVAEFSTLGKQAPVRAGNLQFFSNVPRMPQMDIGRSYLVIATQPSQIGLSTSVGLGQGLFRIYSEGKDDETAVNEANNAGLFRDMAPPAATLRTAAASLPSSGPIAYQELARHIRAIVQ